MRLFEVSSTHQLSDGGSSSGRSHRGTPSATFECRSCDDSTQPEQIRGFNRLPKHAEYFLFAWVVVSAGTSGHNTHKQLRGNRYMATGKQRTDGGQASDQAIERRRRGRPLTKWIADEPKQIAELLPLMVSVLEAIAKANATEAHFCSLHPGKILVREDQSVQIATHKPFELGKTFDLGSAKYTYPEFFGEAAPGTPAGANVYIAGFIFYELLLGRKLFDAQFKDVERNSNLGWLAWHADVTKRATSLNELNRYPAFICRIVDRMIEKNSANRLTDINGIARLFGSVSNATTVYKVVRNPSSGAALATTLAASSNEPRSWLANLGRQKLWTSLWKYVAPNEPQLRQRSIEELERMFRAVETTFGKLRSIVSFSHSARRKARS
jgi:hypothetical protein